MLAPAAAIEPEPVTIPTWWLNSVIATFLLPIAGLLTGTFFTAFSEAAVEHAFWATEEFWFFGLGALLWVLWFIGSIWSMGEPRPIRAYIFGHELTHAIWVWMMGGRVKHFEVRRDGGHILTDTHNFWIALAPYFYPIYSMALMAVYGAISVFYDVAHSDLTLLTLTALQWLFLMLGVSWSFHMSFTCWMIPKGQSDLTSHGTYFSLVVIYIVNLAVLSAFLIIAAPEVTVAAFGADLLENTENLAEVLWSLLRRPVALFD